MKIKKIFKAFLPYGIVCKYKEMQHSKTKSFWDEYMQYVNSGARYDFLTESPVRAVVSLTGLGHTGSGAVADLLREYDKVIVVGGVDEVGSLATVVERKYEVDFLRLAGGLFEIERYLDTHNCFFQDAVLHRFMLMMQHSEIYREMPETRPYFFEFFNRICLYFDDVPYHCTNSHLNYEGMNNILLINHQSVSEYRKLCRQLLYSLFHCYQVKTDDILVMDAFVGDQEFDYDRYVDYIPNIKPIFVYRDPRDIYVFAIEHELWWIAHSSVDQFIMWYKRMWECLDLKKLQGFYVTSFERLIKEYKTVVCEIENFLQLNSANHIHPLEKFNPEISARGIGMWKKHPELAADFAKIKETLGYLIYYED